MINALLTGILRFGTFILSILLAPINTYISNNLPQVNDAFNLIGNFFTMAGNYAGWVRDSMFIETETMALIIATLGIKLTIPLLVSGVKLIAKWWDTIIA